MALQSTDGKGANDLVSPVWQVGGAEKRAGKEASGQTQISLIGTFPQFPRKIKCNALGSGDLGSSVGYTVIQVALGLDQVPLSLPWVLCARLSFCLSISESRLSASVHSPSLLQMPTCACVHVHELTHTHTHTHTDGFPERWKATCLRQLEHFS